MTLWDTRSEATELLDAFVRLINSLEWVTGWKSGKLTAVLHRKRPRFVPILDSVVVDVLAPHDGVVHRQDRLDRACTALGALRQELLERREKLEQVVQGVARQRPELGRISLVRVADVLMRVRDGEPVSWIWEGAGWR